MSVNVHVAQLLNCFEGDVPVRLAEKYYRRKLQCACFLLKQSGMWTIVTINS